MQQDMYRKISEKDVEDVLEMHPELIEPGLTFKGRQVMLFGRRIDLLFLDRHGRQLIVELKNGPILDAHIGQIMSYEGMLLTHENPDIRVMLIGLRVPPNIRRVLDHHGIGWKELSYQTILPLIKREGHGYRSDSEPSADLVREKMSVSQHESKPIQFSKGTHSAITMGTAGIKIYKGASATMSNVYLTLQKPIHLTSYKPFDHEEINIKFRELQSLEKDVFSWAGLAAIQKGIHYGDKIYFLLTDTSELFGFTYRDSIYDPESEYQSFVGWIGRGFEHVVFLTDKKHKVLTPSQTNYLIGILDAHYSDSAARYIYKPIVSGIRLLKLEEALNG